jgi:hypothetical protein
MRRRFAGALAGLALLFSAGAALAAGADAVGRVAEPGSPVDKAGQAILYFVGGRTIEEAANDGFNPFGIDGEMLLYTAGSFFINSTAHAGEDLHEGEFSIFPQYQTPRGAFAPSAEQPPVIPFAFMKSGVCHAGYVGGFPVADRVYEVDLAGAACHAASVEDLLYAAYETGGAAAPLEAPGVEEAPQPAPVTFNPAMPSDGDLALAVWAAYNGAYARAMQHPDYLFFNGRDYQAVHDAMAAELRKEGLQDIVIAGVPSASFAATRACGRSGQTELRVAFTPDGSGIAISAVSSRRIYGYEYDPAVSRELVTLAARECATSGPGRESSAGASPAG